MLELLVVKNAAQRISQRVKRTSGVRVSIFCCCRTVSFFLFMHAVAFLLKQDGLFFLFIHAVANIFEKRRFVFLFMHAVANKIEQKLVWGV